MPLKIRKQCTNPLCFAAMRGEVFPAKTTKCRYCQHAVTAVAVMTDRPSKGGSKGGGKSISRSSSSAGPSIGKKTRRKAVKKFTYKAGSTKPVSIKPPAHKTTAGKPVVRKRGA